MTLETIDLQRLRPFIEGIWTIEEAQSAFSGDFTKPVSPDIKKHLWEIIKIARLWRQIYPQTKVTSVKYPGGGGGG